MDPFHALPTRRALLDLGARIGMGAAGVWALRDLGLARAAFAATPGDYKALVCVFLRGGNDSFNLFVPRKPDDYAAYLESRQTLAVPFADLLPVVAQAAPPVPFGFHPACPEIRDLFVAGKLAVLSNVGTLVEPITPAAFRANAALAPPQLFSHADQEQQWVLSTPTSVEAIGWGGLLADRLTARNAGSPLALNVSVSGSNTFQVGRVTAPYVLGANGSVGLDGLQGALNVARRQAFEALLGLRADHVMARELARTQARSIEVHEVLRAALAATPPLAARFPATSLGLQLDAVARTISIRGALSMSRQIFFVSMNGFDTHDDQAHRQPILFRELSTALAAFQTALAELGVQDRVTTFTASEFGRTLTSNGDGSDHGWGGHQLVMGAAVRGGRVFGRFPLLAIDGPNDGGDGRIVPTSSVSQYAATLARWFGASESEIDDVFPDLGAFALRDLGFLA